MIPCYTRAISERFRDKELIIKRYINLPSLLFLLSALPGYTHVAYIQQILKMLLTDIMFAINNCSNVRHCYASAANDNHQEALRVRVVRLLSVRPLTPISRVAISL